MYTRAEKMDIARLVVEHKITYKEAIQKFSISYPTIANWVATYKTEHHINSDGRKRCDSFEYVKNDVDSLSEMTREQLIDEVIKARIGEERAKKGYTVKGGGQSKEYVSISNKTIE